MFGTSDDSCQPEVWFGSTRSTRVGNLIISGSKFKFEPKTTLRGGKLHRNIKIACNENLFGFSERKNNPWKSI